MATVTTEGWDLLAVANQSLLNDGLALLYNDKILPSDVNYSVDGYSFKGTLGQPVVDLNPTSATGTNSIAAISFPISGVVIISGTSNTIPDGATFAITSDLTYVSVVLEGKPVTQLYLDLSSKNAIYSIKLDVTPEPFWVIILNALIQGYLQNNFSSGTYYLATVDMSAAPAQLQPTGSLYFAIQDNTANPDANILAVVANTSTGKTGVLDFTDNPALLPAGENAALFISNRCLLVNIVLPQLATHLKVPQTDFNISGSNTAPYNVTLNTNVSISGQYSPVLNSMNIYVNNSAQIQSDYGATGYPLSAFESIIWVNVTGSFYLTPTLTNQTISINADTPNGDGSLHLTAAGWAIVSAVVIATWGTVGLLLAGVIAIVVPIVITQLQLSISMTAIAQQLNDANISFAWPAQQYAPIKSIALPGDLILYVTPQLQ